MHTRLNRLKQFLTDLGKLNATRFPTEEFEVTIERFKAKALFTETATLTPQNDAEGLAYFEQSEPIQDFSMTNGYRMSVVIENYGGDIDKVIRAVMYWMHKENLEPELSGLAEQNNQSTYDLFIDLDISEKSQKTVCGVTTC